MSDADDIKKLLVEIRDNQRLSLQRQEEQLEIAREQVERSRTQVQETIALQRQAIERVKRISRLAIPAILGCFALILYLLVNYL